MLTGCANTAAAPHALPFHIPSQDDWPTYGYDAQHTFDGHTTLNAKTAATLKQAWYFPTGDAVTATPTVVDGTVYAINNAILFVIGQ